MEDWVERAIKEKDDLDERIFKLEAFLDSDNCWDLSMTAQLLIYNQLDHMVQYSALLGQRIEQSHD